MVRYLPYPQKLEEVYRFSLSPVMQPLSLYHHLLAAHSPQQDIDLAISVFGLQKAYR